MAWVAVNIARFVAVCLAAATTVALAADGSHSLTWNPIGWVLQLLVAVLVAIVGVALLSPMLAAYLAFELAVLRVASGRGGRPLALAAALAPLAILERDDDRLIFAIFVVAAVAWGLVVRLPSRIGSPSP